MSFEMREKLARVLARQSFEWGAGEKLNVPLDDYWDFILAPGNRENFRQRADEIIVLLAGAPDRVLRDAIQSVVDYNWHTEEADYHEQDEEGQANHIFRDLRMLNEHLKRPGR